MTIRLAGDAVILEDICTVEDAESLAQALQTGATVIDWTNCTHLHTACLQVILAAGALTRGVPVNADLALWLAPLLPSEKACASSPGEADRQTPYRAEI